MDNDRSESRTTNGRFKIRLALLIIIIFMLITIILAIIFVMIFWKINQHSNSNGKQGIILMLIFIAIIYLIGLFGLIRSNLSILILFATINLILATICLIMNPDHHYSYHYYDNGLPSPKLSHNWVASIAFILTSTLTIVYVVVQYYHQQYSKFNVDSNDLDNDDGCHRTLLQNSEHSNKSSSSTTCTECIDQSIERIFQNDDDIVVVNDILCYGMYIEYACRPTSFYRLQVYKLKLNE
ncbi:hypothetical protein DERP_013713 [Dermatophagoides pteronyssinus]|uniref:Uncharacterized protein n=1 Tax=Dermatophagoides pteronyssinus TaxID=6956 RepID=A0ABQ8JV74_DERPT|nr:hypothetical protein DERP_013713 [Dermatophagoides pteronyssinus]